MALELGHLVVFQRIDHLIDEQFRGHIDDLGARIGFTHQVAGRLHQMGFAEADLAVDEQWVVGATRTGANPQRRGSRQLIGITLDVLVEDVLRIHAAARI